MEAAGRGGRRAGGKQGQNRNTVGSPEECPVCLEGFGGGAQRPRTLPCGHTLCTRCISQLKERGRVACPECRVSHAVPEGGQFPVCYAVEALIRVMKGAAAAPEGAASPPPGAEEGKEAAGQQEAAVLSKKMRSFLQEQETKLVAAIAACQETQCQLDLYRTSLTDWGGQQWQLEDRLLALVGQSRSARLVVQQEDSLVAAKSEEVKKGKQGLEAVLATMRAATTEQQAGAALAKMIHCSGDAEQVRDECRECFPEASTTTALREAREASSSALEAARAIQTGLDTLHTVTTKGLAPKFGSEDLRSLTQPVRRLLEAGLVFAVSQEKDRRRHARISLEGDQVYLHALTSRTLPVGAATLQMKEVVAPCPPTAFLDLSWPGSAPRRVQIRLKPNTPRGRQFLFLCTGHCGPSYVNAKLNQVVNKRGPGEYVEGGDFKSSGGHWESVLLPGLELNEHQERGEAGMVFGLRWSDSNKGDCGRFGICTRRRQDGGLWHYAFGRVVEGLHVVAEAAQHRDVAEVTVVDCGMLL